MEDCNNCDRKEAARRNPNVRNGLTKGTAKKPSSHSEPTSELLRRGDKTVTPAVSISLRWKQERQNMRWKIVTGTTGLLLAALTCTAQEKAAYSIAGAQSKLEIHVSKEGAFKAFGHDHLIAAKEIFGEAQVDVQKIEASTVRLQIATKSLTVVDPGESEKDRKEVQATMVGEKVLDIAKFPEISFTSSGVSGAKKTARGWELTISG